LDSIDETITNQNEIKQQTYTIIYASLPGWLNKTHANKPEPTRKFKNCIVVHDNKAQNSSEQFFYLNFNRIISAHILKGAGRAATHDVKCLTGGPS